MKRRVVLLMLFLCALPLCSAELKQGATGVVISLPEFPAPSVKLAAEELQSALKKVLNIEAALEKESASGSQASFRFLVGPQKKYPLPAGLAADGFVIDAPAPGTLRLAGVDNDVDPLKPFYHARTGTLYAVYRFMREKLNVAMLWPGESGTVYPRLTSVSTDHYTLRDAPKMPIRSSYYGYGNRYSKESLRNAVRWGRFNGLGCSWMGFFNHSSHLALNDKYVKTHPEYYALIRGKRVIPDPNARARWKICHSNPELPAVFAEWGMKLPNGKDFFPVSPNDGPNWCECGECRKLDGGQVGRYHDEDDPFCTSGRVFALADRTARELEKRGSRQLVALYSYSVHTDPPANLPKLHDQVLVAVCKGISWRLIPEDRKKFDGLMKEWSVRAKNVLLRDYPGVCRRGTAVTPYPHLAAQTLKDLYHSYRNFCGIDNSGDDSRSYALWGPTQFVLARLLWDPEQDVEKLLDEYYQRGWPRSHKFVCAYFEYFEKRTEQLRKKQKSQYPGNLLSSFDIMTAEAVAQGNKLLKQAAQAAAPDKEELARVEFLRIALEAAALNTAYYRALAETGCVHLVKGTAQGMSLSALEQARKTVAARNAFMKKHKDHEGIPSAIIFHMAGDAGSEKDLENKYEAAKRRPAAAVISLAEEWKFSLDDPGVAENFAKPEYDDASWRPITTNAAWEKQGFPGYNGWGFYRRTVTVPADWAGGQVLLVLGAVDESYRVYCDGKLVESYQYDAKKDPSGWIKERRIDVTPYAQPGSHLIAVAVHDHYGDGGIWRPASLQLIRPNLLTDDPLKTLESGVREGNVITSAQNKFRLRALEKGLAPGDYTVILRFTPQSGGAATVYMHTRDAKTKKWYSIGKKSVSCKSGNPQVFSIPFTIPRGSFGINAIFSIQLKKMIFGSLEVVPAEKNK